MPKPYTPQLPKVLVGANCLPNVLAPKHSAKVSGVGAKSMLEAYFMFSKHLYRYL